MFYGHVFFPTNLHSERARGCSVSVCSIVGHREHLVQLSTSSVNAGGESGKVHSLAELIMILSE